MVGTVQVLTIPAGREVVDSHDASRARLLGEAIGLTSSRVDVLKTRVTEAWVTSLGVGRAADCHAETLGRKNQPLSLESKPGLRFQELDMRFRYL